jgi:peroxiredoxin
MRMKVLRHIATRSIGVCLVFALHAAAGQIIAHVAVQKKPELPVALPPVKKASANYGKYLFTMRSVDGTTIRLADEAGKYVLVTIWSPGCTPCERETDALVKIYNRYHGLGLDIIGVAVKTTETDLRAFQQKHGVKWLLGIHDEILNSYGMYGLPDHYLFGPDGTLLKHYMGLVREDVLRNTFGEIFRSKAPPSRPSK